MTYQELIVLIEDAFSELHLAEAKIRYPHIGQQRKYTPREMSLRINPICKRLFLASQELRIHGKAAVD